MLPEDLDEEVLCKYCRKTVRFRDMEDWLKLSDITEDMESNPEYFCSFECLKAWANQSEVVSLARMGEKIRDRQWLKEEKEMQKK